MEKNPKLKIEIEAVDKATKTLEEASKALKELSSSFKQTAKSAQDAEKKQISFFSTLRAKTQKAGKYVDELNSRFRRLENSIFNLKTAIAAALGGLTLGKIVKDGIEFNAQLQTAKLGLAALISSYYRIEDSQGRILSGMKAFKAAQEEAEKLYTDILNRAMQTAATSKELFETFQAVLPFAANLGMSLEQVLNLSEALVNAAKAIGLAEGQAAQEGRDLLMGYVDQNDQLLRALNLSTDILKTWQQQGTLYENVMEKLRYFVQASGEFADTWDGVTSSISDLISILEGSVFKGTFHVINEELKKLRDYLQSLTKDPKKLEQISNEIANKFIDLSIAAVKSVEAVYVAGEKAFSFGKEIFNFINSNKELTEYGVLGYLLLGKKGILLGSIIGGLVELAEKSKDAFPTTGAIFRAQPNAKSVIGIAEGMPSTFSSDTFKKFEEYKKKHGKVPNKPVELPIGEQEKENDPVLSTLDALIKGLESSKINIHNKPNVNQNNQNQILNTLSALEVSQNLSNNLSFFSPPASLTDRLLNTLNKQPFSNISFGASKKLQDYLSLQPEYSFDPVLFRLQTEKKLESFKSEYLEFAKEAHPNVWKEEKLKELKQWYEEQKKILGESTELQELYEHKKLEIEKEAHEKEKKLYYEKLKQTSSWKAGVFKSLDQLKKKWSDTNQQIYDGTTQVFQALENSLETMFFDAMRGKLKSLGDYVNSFIASVESAIAGIAAQGVASSIVSFGKSIFGFKAADGGVIQGHFVPLKAFATGGIVDKPTLGLVGEGRYPEAIVPLPDGRSIPVKFEGGKGQPINLEIVIVDDRSKIPPPQIGKEQIVLTVAEDINNNGILRKVIQSAR